LAPRVRRREVNDLPLLAAVLLLLELMLLRDRDRRSERVYTDHEVPGDPSRLGQTVFEKYDSELARFQYGSGGGRRLPRYAGAD
jgi:hypothetical protein